MVLSAVMVFVCCAIQSRAVESRSWLAESVPPLFGSCFKYASVLSHKSGESTEGILR